MSKIKLKIDDKFYAAEEGQTILEVAREKGIHIPTLCYNEKTSRTTSCFVCVVKDKKSGKFMPSCTATVTDGLEIEASSDEVLDMRQTALNLLLSEHTGDCEAPCTLACPAHAQVEEYVRAGREGDLLKALKIIKERVPLPLSIGRVCPRFCEKDCRRNVTDEGQPVAINDFKRLAADLHYSAYMEELPSLEDKKVAIIGAGPAGLSVAYFLRRNGVKSDLFDKMPKPGGMLRYGIPEYRLPKKILDKELTHFGEMGGITFHCNQKLETDISLENLEKNYDAVAIAVGSWRSSSMRSEGEELAVGGIDWLEQIARKGWQGKNPGRTIVVGGGNTAMDCVRTAVRLESESVWCYYRRTEKEMPAEQIEIDEAREEGVNFKFLSQPIRVREEKGDKVVTFLKMKLGEPDASGRRRPVPIEGSEYDVHADTVIAAIGQKTKAPEGVKTNRWGDVDVDEKNCQMCADIFAAGDCVSGPATVVEAVAGGRRAALGILSHFKNEEYSDPYLINISRGHWQALNKEDLVFLKEPVKRKRQKLTYIHLKERKTTFKEVTRTFTKAEIAKEGERCFECSCTAKEECKLKEYAECYGAHPETITGEKIAFEYDTRHPDIILDRGKCIKCGTCIKICKEVVNKSLLGFRDRGFKTNLTTPYGAPLPEEFCRQCGECIEACPVGALDWRAKDN